MFKEDVINPDGTQIMLLHKNKMRNFDDLKRALIEFKVLTADPNKIRAETLTSSIIQNYLNDQNHKTTDSKRTEDLKSTIARMVSKIEALINHTNIKASMYVLLKIWDQVYT